MPSVPDAWLELLSTPFPCLIGLSPTQARHLPANLPTRMAVLQLDDGHLGEPRERPPPLPSREAGPLQALFGRLREQAWRAARDGAERPLLMQAQLNLGGERGGGDRSGGGGGAAMDVETAARRGALDFFASLLRDVSSFFPETSEASETSEGVAMETGADVDVDAQCAAFVAAQPAQSRSRLNTPRLAAARAASHSSGGPPACFCRATSGP